MSSVGEKGVAVGGVLQAVATASDDQLNCGSEQDDADAKEKLREKMAFWGAGGGGAPSNSNDDGEHKESDGECKQQMGCRLRQNRNGKMSTSDH